jgi:hypothetical protein
MDETSGGNLGVRRVPFCTKAGEGARRFGCADPKIEKNWKNPCNRFKRFDRYNR